MCGAAGLTFHEKVFGQRNTSKNAGCVGTVSISGLSAAIGCSHAPALQYVQP